MESLIPLTQEMRALGIRTLTVELEPAGAAAVQTLPAEAAETPPEPKPAGQCAYGNCRNPNGGVFGTGTEYCEHHALTVEMGVKP